MLSQFSYNLRFKFVFYLTIILLMQNNAIAKQRICGKMLTDVLATVCVNGFNFRIKRCLDGRLETRQITQLDDAWFYRLKDILRKLEAEVKDSDTEVIKINFSIRNQDKNLKRKRKDVEFVGTTGVADECCTNGCVYADILMYCA